MNTALCMQIGLAAKQWVAALTQSAQRVQPHHLRCQALRVAYLMFYMVCIQALGSTSALAWTLFEAKTLYEEVELSASEAKKVQYAAGWSAKSDTELLVEVKNNLPGPLACHGPSAQWWYGEQKLCSSPLRTQLRHPAGCGRRREKRPNEGLCCDL
jgi:hypothetical protein